MVTVLLGFKMMNFYGIMKVENEKSSRKEQEYGTEAVA